MGVVTYLSDRLTNILSGMGTTIDRRVADFYAFRELQPIEVEAAYRSSWLTRKIIDIPPFDMTREWRDWQAEATAIEKLEAEERRLQLKAKCQRALVLSRLYGGGALILGTKDTEPAQELRPDSVKAGGLTYVHVMSRHQLSEGQIRLDPVDPYFGQPEYFEVRTTGAVQQIRLHPSRVVAFIGQKAPEGAQITSQSQFWGDPIMQSIETAVKNADLAQAGFATLIDEAKIDILKMPQLSQMVATAEYEQRVTNRLNAVQLGKSTLRAMLLDAEEEWEQKQITWDGMPEILFAYLQIVAGAADIPITRMLGQSPKGLQSTGDGEERDYHAMVKARQEELLCPALDRIDELLIRSALGTRPPDVYYEFAPLSAVPESEAATIEKQFAETMKTYTDAALVPTEVATAIIENHMIESGRFPGSETAWEENRAAVEQLFEEPEGPDPSALQAGVAAMQQRGAITAEQADALIRDAQPRTLYVQRKLLNADEFIRWAKGQGFDTTTPADELHVTVTFSRTPVDWLAMGDSWSGDEKGNITINPGGPRLVEPLGDEGAVVLLFASSPLSWRHEEMMRLGASWDFPEYQPHVTITYVAPGGLDLSTVEPYRGKLVFGPEIFEEVVEDWEKGLVEA